MKYVVYLLAMCVFMCCSASRHSYNQKKGLMLLKTHEHSRNYKIITQKHLGSIKHKRLINKRIKFIFIY